MCTSSQRVVEVYHGYAYCALEQDEWARTHVHGLDPFLLIDIGFPTECELINDFKRWIANYNVCHIYANGARTEARKLGLAVCDICLPPWAERVRHDYHRIPNFYKLHNECFESRISCHESIHGYHVRSSVTQGMSDTQIAKVQHGWHCSLYEVYELYFFYREHYFK